jgi:NADH:ubiquinone oxidoreductase subunit 5 (subunit L)/multisubunit Na+/H+ antiporter MnhA subunit
MNSVIHHWLFYLAGAIGTLFYGISCFTIFFWPHKENKDQAPKPKKRITSWDHLKKEKVLWVAHQIWLNLAGAFFGWVAIYYALKESIAPTNIPGLLVWTVGFIGITGHLPVATVGLIQWVADKLVEKLGTK